MRHLRKLFFKTGLFSFPVFLTKINVVNAVAVSEISYFNKNDGRISVTSTIGRRRSMEDRYSLMADIPKGIFLYGVFDGHGGQWAADFTQKNLLSSLLYRFQKEDAKHTLTSPVTSKILTEEVLALDEQILEITEKNRDHSGTTALIAVIYKNLLTVANVGDSRGVLCDSKGETISLSFDHKPDDLKESTRIKQAGGTIEFWGTWRVDGILAMSRALGDYPLKVHNHVIADPDIRTFDLKEYKPQFMILATDGLWDTMSNEEAVRHIKDYIDSPDHGSEFLAKLSFKKGSPDNISVIVVDLRNFPSQVEDGLQESISKGIQKK